MHLVYLFDLNDPEVPWELPDNCWLPLYYCFDFRVKTIAYQLESDESIRFFIDLNQAHTTEHEEWPADDFPMQFPSHPVTIEPYEYEPQDVDDAYLFAGVFGTDHLSAYDWEGLKQRIFDDAEEYDLPMPETDEDLQEFLEMPFLNGKPESRCLNPECKFAGQAGDDQLQPIALVPGCPAEDVHLFGEHGDFTRVYFQLCRACRTMRADVC